MDGAARNPSKDQIVNAPAFRMTPHFSEGLLSLSAGDSEAYQIRREIIFDRVWSRQILYFSVLGALFLLLSLPLWEGLIDSRFSHLKFERAFDESAGMVFGGLVGLLKPVTPSYLSPYLGALHSHSSIVLMLIAYAVIGFILSNRSRDRIRDLSREIWKPSDGATRPAIRNAARTSIFPLVRWLRKLQASFHSSGLNPADFFGMATVVAGFVFVGGVAIAGYSRLVFNVRLGGGHVCASSQTQDLKWLGSDGSLSADKTFQTNQPCWASGAVVEKGASYRLRIDILEPWFDADIMTDVGGFESDGALRKILKTPFLRWPTEGWFTPIARIGGTGDVEWPLAANDGSGPIPADSAGCKRMPKSYFETREFCELHHQEFRSALCDDERRHTEKEMSSSFFFASSPLSGPELEAVN